MSKKSPPNADLVPIGEVVGVFGLEGAVKVFPLTDFAERFDPGERVFVNGDTLKINKCTWHKSQARLWLQGVDTVERAEGLRGAKLMAIRADRPELEEDEFYSGDLLGLRVVTVEGETLGSIDAVIPSPGHDLFQIGELLIPAAKSFIKKIDLKKRVMTVQLIPGMRPGEDAVEVR